eukprot:TRINITY_DN58935_c0_g1_i1.p2 TRINITY_DN58935_c0_g1~~TRINITY_DN58935_c0_g1_i1.p2  ORF type:complete len:561 (+),score=107.38 TRINITY_DN58935_c0_g1_i1:46-1728(+)
MASKALTAVLDSVADKGIKTKIIDMCLQIAKTPLSESEIKAVGKKFGIGAEEPSSPKMLDDPVDIMGETKMSSLLNELADELVISDKPSKATPTTTPTLEHQAWAGMGITAEVDSSVWSMDIAHVIEYPTGTLRIAPKDMPENPSPMEVLAVVIVAEDAFYQGIDLKDFAEKQKESAANLMPMPGMEPQVKKEGPKKHGVWGYEIIMEMAVPTPYGAMMTLVMHQLCALHEGITYLCQLTGPANQHKSWEKKFLALAETVKFTEIPNIAPVNRLVYTNVASKVTIETPQYWMVEKEDLENEGRKVLVRFETMMLDRKRDLIAVCTKDDLEGQALVDSCGKPEKVAEDGGLFKFKFTEGGKTANAVVNGKYLVVALPKEPTSSSYSTSTELLVGVAKSIKPMESAPEGSNIDLVCTRMSLSIPGKVHMRTVEHRFGTPSISCALDATLMEGPTLMLAFAEEDHDLDEWWSKCSEELEKQGNKIRKQDWGTVGGEKAMTVVSESASTPHPFLPFAMPNPQVVYNTIVKHGKDTVVVQFECSPDQWDKYEAELKELMDGLKWL